uniref:TLC domain-containing protein n=1 Tax=Amorphochlora amoebiformis TaxID=1561963 RepID=A0A7S0H4D8_9EUKA
MWSSHILFHNILMAISATYRALPETLYPHKKSHPRIPLVGSCVHINACQDLVAAPLALMIFYLYLWAISLLSGSVESRWRGDEYSFYIGAVLHCSFSIYEVIIYAIVGKQWLFYLHHIVVLIVYFLGASAHQINFYLAWAGLVEVTNFFLSIISFMGRLNMKGNPTYILSGVGLYISYVISRLISVPLAVGFLIKDMVLDPANTWDMSLKPHVVFALLTSVVVYLMSAFWFKKIHRGMTKHLFGNGKHTAGSEVDALENDKSSKSDGKFHRAKRSNKSNISQKKARR